MMIPLLKIDQYKSILIICSICGIFSQWLHVSSTSAMEYPGRRKRKKGKRRHQPLATWSPGGIKETTDSLRGSSGKSGLTASTITGNFFTLLFSLHTQLLSHSFLFALPPLSFLTRWLPIPSRAYCTDQQPADEGGTPRLRVGKPRRFMHDSFLQNSKVLSERSSPSDSSLLKT